LTTTEHRWYVPLSDLIVDDEIVAAVSETVRSGWWSVGPRVAEFEAEFAAFCGSEHALAVANGTAALHLALLALGCGPGDEVLVPSLNFVAAANAIRHTGATPVFVDIVGDDDLNADPADITAALGPATKGILVMHYGGFACDMDAICRIADENGLWILEDAAHAPGATLGGKALGTFGRIGCFSFFSNKNLPVGEGGMAITDDPDLAERLRLLRSHGMTTLTWDRHRGHAHSYDVVAQGFNYRLDELRAAIGLVQLKRLRQENESRGAHAARYRAALDGIEGTSLPFGASGGGRISSHHLCVALLPEGADRLAVRQALEAKRVQTSVHYPPIHMFTEYRGTGRVRELPRTEDAGRRLVTLPLFAHLSDDQVDAVAAALVEAL